MPFIVTVLNRTFTGRKGRKLIAPLQITIAPQGASTLNGCLLRLTVVGGNAAGPFLLEPVPGSWNGNVLNKITVQSVTPFVGNGAETVTAFASFFSIVNSGVTQTFDQDYQIDVIDGAGASIPASTVKIWVTAQPAINKSVVFLLDHTITMGISYGGVTRLQRLQDAMTRGLAFFTATDSIGVVTLDHVTPANLQGATVAVPLLGGTVAAASGACSALTIDGSPANRVYQGSIDAARSQSATATVLIVTDGVTGFTTKLPTSQQATPTSTLFIEATLPNGTLSPPSANATTYLCSPLPGAYAISAPGTGEFAMEKLLSQILIDLGGGAIVSDPDGALGPGDQPLSFPLSLNETDRELQLAVFSDNADLLDVRLEGPGLENDQHQEDCYKGYDSAERVVKFKRITLPPPNSDKSHPRSEYRAVVSHSSTRELCGGGTVKFTFLAALQSDLLLDASVSATGLEVGAELLFSVTLTEYGFSVRDRKGLTVRVELRHPDGGVETLELHDKPGSGRFEGSRQTFRAGVYTAHFVAEGTTWLWCLPFRRETLRSIMIFERGTTDSCCPPLLCC